MLLTSGPNTFQSKPASSKNTYNNNDPKYYKMWGVGGRGWGRAHVATPCGHCKARMLGVGVRGGVGGGAGHMLLRPLATARSGCWGWGRGGELGVGQGTCCYVPSATARPGCWGWRGGGRESGVGLGTSSYAFWRLQGQDVGGGGGGGGGVESGGPLDCEATARREAHMRHDVAALMGKNVRLTRYFGSLFTHMQEQGVYIICKVCTSFARPRPSQTTGRVQCVNTQMYLAQRHISCKFRKEYT